jgi:hypothetical protein
MKTSEYIKLLKEYNELLGEEIEDLIGIASVHGWESRNWEKGAELRKRIAEAEKEERLWETNSPLKRTNVACYTTGKPIDECECGSDHK